MPRGKCYRSQSKGVVMNVFDYFEKLGKKGGSKSAIERTADATGVSVSSVKRMKRERESLDGEDFSTPKRRYVCKRLRVDPDDFDREAIRRVVYESYEKKEHVTLIKLLSILKDRQLFLGKKTSLYRVLREMGFRHKKVNDKRCYYEQPRIIEQRHKYLRRMRKNREEKKPVVYLDETWCNAHDGKEKAWVQKDTVTGGTVGGVKRPSGKGNRLIILHAGSENGWLPHAELVFEAKKTSGDYHDEMNSERFEKWFHDALIPNLAPGTLIVMDNASYHSRRVEPMPVQSWTKARLKEWLDEKGVTYPEQALKKELWSIAKSKKPCHIRYVVDEIASQHGHEVVRLPVAHCELNPIEMAWAQVKGYVKDNNKKFTLSEVKDLVYKGFELVTAERWKKLIKHVEDKVENHYWEKDGLYEEQAFEFVLHFTESDFEDNTSESDSSADSDVDSDIHTD